jgi:hypothetical protein
VIDWRPYCAAVLSQQILDQDEQAKSCEGTAENEYSNKEAESRLDDHLESLLLGLGEQTNSAGFHDCTMGEIGPPPRLTPATVRELSCAPETR